MFVSSQPSGLGSALISIQEFLDARPSAELVPTNSGEEQDDESESEMGMTYDELSTFGVLRKVCISLTWKSFVHGSSQV